MGEIKGETMGELKGETMGELQTFWQERRRKRLRKKDVNFLNNCVIINSPIFYKIVFKNDSPLGFMIEVFMKKPGLGGGNTLFTAVKNEVH